MAEHVVVEAAAPKPEGSDVPKIGDGGSYESIQKPGWYLRKLEAKKLRRREAARAEGRQIRSNVKASQSQAMAHITADGKAADNCLRSTPLQSIFAKRRNSGDTTAQ